MTDRERIVSNVLGLIGAAAGGALGCYAFGWVLTQGFYGLILPGGLLGLGSALLSRHPSTARGAVCGIAAVALGFLSEWKFRPFGADPRFSYFLTHLGQLDSPVITLGMIVVGGLVAYWIGKDSGYTRVSPIGGSPR